MILFTKLLKNLFALRKLLDASTPVRTYGRVRVAITDQVNVPFSVRSLNRFWVILPSSLLMRPTDYKLAIRHELQHHRQCDTLWALFIEVLLCGFFMNPAIYIWKRKITEFQEFSCDEALLGQRGVSSHDYGSCLVRVAETALKAREKHVGTTCMASGFKNPIYFKSFLQRRIEMLVSHQSRPNQRWIGLCLGTLIFIITLGVAYSSERSMRMLEIESKKMPNPGQPVVNEKLQALTEAILREAVEFQKAKEGFAIVADPNTGKILAISNVTTDPNKSGELSLAYRFEPASLVKVLIAAKAIDQGLTSPTESHNCENGNYQFGDRIYHDWKSEGWSSLTTEETIVHSSDICTIKIAEKLGKDGILKTLKDFGFGPDGISKNFPGALSGIMPREDDPKKQRLIPFVSSGFGYRNTPIEMLQAFGAIANGGNLLKPLQANALDSEKEIIRRALSPETAEKMRLILQQVVIKGTGRGRVESTQYTTAGKTATGFSTSRLGTSKYADFAQFVGFAPAVNPRVEVYVAIRDPKWREPGNKSHGAHGSMHAGPVFVKLVDSILKEMQVAPDKRSI